MSEREKEMKANREKDKGNEVCLSKKGLMFIYIQDKIYTIFLRLSISCKWTTHVFNVKSYF